MTNARAPGRLLAIAFLAFVSVGLLDGVLGVAWPSMRRTFARSLDELGLLLACAMVGHLATSAFSGSLVARFGVGRLLLASGLAMLASSVGRALAPVWWPLPITALLAGLGAGAIDAGVNAYAATRFSARVVNWLHACYGLGALTGPLLMTASLQSSLGWRLGYGLIALALTAMTLGFAATRSLWQIGAGSSTTAATALRAAPVIDAGALATLRHRPVWTNVLLFFLYCGLEVSAGQWIYSLLTESRGIAGTTGGVAVSCYWASLTAGRIAFGFAAARIAPETLLRLGMSAAPLATIVLWSQQSSLATFLGLSLLGFSLAPIFPLLIADTPRRVGSRYATMAIGFQVSAACLGTAALPALAGWLAGRLGLETIPPFLLALSVLLLLVHEVALAAGTSPRAPGSEGAERLQPIPEATTAASDRSAEPRWSRD